MTSSFLIHTDDHSSVYLWRMTTVTLWVLSSVPLHSFLRSMYLTGNQRCASPMTVSMWCWTAWTGIQSMRFTWWQRISRDGQSPASAPSEQLQSPLPSQVLFPSTQPEHPHTHEPQSSKGLHRDQKKAVLLRSLTITRSLCKAYWL